MVLLVGPSIFAQGCCTGGAPILGGSGLIELQPGQLLTKLRYNVNHQSRLFQGADLIELEGRSRTTQSSILEIHHQINNRIALGLITGYKWDVETSSLLITEQSKLKIAGFTDVLLQLQANLFQSKNHALFGTTSVKLPLGQTQLEDETSGIRLPENLQPGTGSWDFAVGGSYKYSGFPWPQSVLLTQSTYIFKTSGARFNGAAQYAFGNDWTTTIALGHQFTVGKIFINPAVDIQSRYAAVDRLDELPIPNSGGFWLYSSVGAEFQILNGSSFGIHGSLPFYQNLKGTQLTTAARIQFSFSHTFNFRKSGLLMNETINYE